MKKLLIGLLLGIASLIGIVKSEAIVRIVGTTGQCDTTISGCNPIPLIPTTLCVASCVQNIAPDWKVPTRLWGVNTNACRVSVNGGVTWGACGTSNPTGSGGQTFIAGTGDGAAVVIGDNGVNNCLIKRSTDGGTVWTTVFTSAVIGSSSCTGQQGNSKLQCLSDGRCAYFGTRVTDSKPIVIHSDDNGLTWSISAGATAVPGGTVAMTWVGTDILGPAAAAGQRSAFVQTAGWLVTASTGTWAEFCQSGINGVTGVCFVASTNTIHFRDNQGTLLSTSTLPGALTTNNTGLAFQYQSSVYVLDNKKVVSGTVPFGIWVVPSSGGTGILLYTSPITANSSSFVGDMFFANGCIYFVAGTTSTVGKIC